MWKKSEKEWRRRESQWRIGTSMRITEAEQQNGTGRKGEWMRDEKQRDAGSIRKASMWRGRYGRAKCLWLESVGMVGMRRGGHEEETEATIRKRGSADLWNNFLRGRLVGWSETFWDKCATLWRESQSIFSEGHYRSEGRLLEREVQASRKKVKALLERVPGEAKWNFLKEKHNFFRRKWNSSLRWSLVRWSETFWDQAKQLLEAVISEVKWNFLRPGETALRGGHKWGEVKLFETRRNSSLRRS
jgi:hypothetical protein